MIKAQGGLGMGDQLLQKLGGVAFSVEDNDMTIYHRTADIRICRDPVAMIVLDPDGTICLRVV
jgi:hypothetical protein